MPLWCAASWFGTSLVCVLRVPAALPQRSPMKNLAQHESTTACDFSSTHCPKLGYPSRRPKRLAACKTLASKQRLRTGPEESRASLSKDKARLSLGSLGQHLPRDGRLERRGNLNQIALDARAARLPACGLQRLVCDTHGRQAEPRGAAFAGRKPKPWRRHQQQARRRPRMTN